MIRSKKVLGKATNSETIGLLRSGLGMGPCAVFLKERCDFFGPREPQQADEEPTKHRGGTGIWCIGNCLKKTESTASIRLLDQSEEDVAEEDVYLLSKLAVENHCSNSEIRLGCKSLTIIENPEALELGDLVYGEFQNGIQVEFTTETTKVLFRGRVAAVDQSTRTCDICYDDGDYEMSVPYAHVIRVLLNEHKAAWINGISISNLSSTSLKHRETGTLATGLTISADNNNSVSLCCSTTNEQWNRKVSRVAAMQRLFNEAKQNCVSNKRSWKWPQKSAIVSPRKRLSPSAEEKQSHQPKQAREQAASSKKSKPTSHRKPLSTNKTPSIVKQDVPNEYTTPLVRRPQRSKRLPVYKSENEDDVDADDDDDVPMGDCDLYGGKLVVATGTSIRRTLRSTARKGTRQPPVVRSDVMTVPEEVMPATPIEPLPDYPVTLVEMNRMETSTISKILSDDPVAAQELLSMHLVVEGKKPSEDFWKTIMKLILYGPMHDEVFFPDPYRMEIVTDYILSLFRIHGLLHDCTNCLSDIFCGNEAYGDVFLKQMAEGYYMAKDDFERETSTERILNTAHAKSCSARVFLEMIKFLFHDCVVGRKEPPCKVLFQQTPKECLRQGIIAAKSIWKLAPRATGIVFRELTESWGTILSYLAWMYGQYASEDADALADLLSDISHSVPSDVLFHVIDTLKPDILPQVRPKLAERWNLSEEYNRCYSI